MKILRVILGDQLSEDISSLKETDKKNDIILMCEVWDETRYVKHHIKKSLLFFPLCEILPLILRKKGTN